MMQLHIHMLIFSAMTQGNMKVRKKRCVNFETKPCVESTTAHKTVVSFLFLFIRPETFSGNLLFFNFVINIFKTSFQAHEIVYAEIAESI